MEHTFITYQKALAIIADHKSEFEIVSQKLEACIGSFLAEDLIADRDFPPFDRVTMDGIAINYNAFQNGQRSFNIETIAAAGSPQCTLKNPQNCIEVMTGAIMPEGVDTVIRYEDVELKNDTATVNLKVLKHRQNVHFKGSDISQGTRIVAKGKRLSSAEITIAATIGKAHLKVQKMPRVVIFSTGDELVAINETPAPHQIRKSNVYGIQATLKEWGIAADLEHLEDDKEKMTSAIAASLETYEVFIFTGGVSKGKFDYLPEVLEELQIKKHFHKIQQRPGKPFWFGSKDQAKVVFALPGNPVSSFVCTYSYISYWLIKSLGIPLEPTFVELQSDLHFKPDLVYFLQAKLESLPNGKLAATPIKGNGSGDFANLVNADGFLILPQGKSEFKRGEVFEFIRYRNQL